jgi:hypothetical protein
MRDGLLVGTEVFVPGQYTLGSGEGVDLKLEDPGVAASHVAPSVPPSTMRAAVG